jgi:hypothetical protein
MANERVKPRASIITSQAFRPRSALFCLSAFGKMRSNFFSSCKRLFRYEVTKGYMHRESQMVRAGNTCGGRSDQSHARSNNFS